MIFPRISRFKKNYIAYVIRKLYVEYTLVNCQKREFTSNNILSTLIRTSKNNELNTLFCEF